MIMSSQSVVDLSCLILLDLLAALYAAAVIVFSICRPIGILHVRIDHWLLGCDDHVYISMIKLKSVVACTLLFM